MDPLLFSAEPANRVKRRALRFVLWNRTKLGSVLAAAPLGRLLPVLDQARPGFAACLDGWLSPELPCGAHMSKTQGQGLTRVN